jgi:hypothetical protein
MDRWPPLFGNNSERRRIIDIADSKGISRTHAITWFPPQSGTDELSSLKEKIFEGALAGKTFREYGYEVLKEPIAEGVVRLLFWLKHSFNSKEDLAKVNVYEFWGCKEGRKVLYGVIAEINSPDFDSVVGENNFLRVIKESKAIDIQMILNDLENYLTFQ